MLEENADVVARVSKTFGQNGELTLNLYNTFPQDCDLSEPLFVVIGKLAVPLFVTVFNDEAKAVPSLNSEISIPSAEHQS